MKGDIKQDFLWQNPSLAEPIFIVGCQRSGTTLLRTILHSHPSISIGYESGFYKKLSDKYDNQSLVINEYINEFVDDLHQLKRFEYWNLSKDFLITKFKELNFNISFPQAVLYIAYLYQQENKPEATSIGFKNPNGILHIPFIFNLFPKAKIIHIIRDVRGIYASEKKKNQKNNQYNSALYLWKVSTRWKKAIELLDQYENDSRVYHIFYNELIENMEDSLKQLCEWLNINPSPEMFSYYEINQEKKLTPDRELWQHSKTLEKPDSSRINAYEKELSLMELKAIELLCYKEISRLDQNFSLNYSHLVALPLVLQVLTQKITGNF